MCGTEKNGTPDWKIEPAKVFGMALMLQIMENGYLGATAKERCREPWVEQDVNTLGRGSNRESGLLPQDSCRPVRCTDALLQGAKVFRARWHERIAGFAICPD